MKTLLSSFHLAVDDEDDDDDEDNDADSFFFVESKLF